MFSAILSSRALPLIIVSWFSIMLVQRIIMNHESQTRKKRGKPRIFLPAEVHQRSKSLKVPTALGLSAISLGCIFRSLHGIFQVIDVLTHDFGDNHRQSGTGVYRASISPQTISYQPISQTNSEPIVASVVQIKLDKSHEYTREIQKLTEVSRENGMQFFSTRKGQFAYFYLLPNGLILENSKSKILLPGQDLFEGSSDWETIKIEGKTSNNSPVAITKFVRPRILEMLLGSFSWILQPFSSIRIEFCEKGMKVGAPLLVFGQGRKAFGTLWSKLSNMKLYIKERFAKNFVLLFGATLVFTLSLRYFFLNQPKDDFKMSMQRVENGINSLYYPIKGLKDQTVIGQFTISYKESEANVLVRCSCGKYLKNVMSFPCGHLASCYHCIITNKHRNCLECNKQIEDYCIVSFS